LDRRKPGTIAVLLASLLLPACVADQPATIAPVWKNAGAGQPSRSMAFRCDGKVGMTVVDTGNAVHVTDSRGADVELAASPPAQRSRYSQPGYALVLEGRKALWMVSGKRPVNCVR
jgi:hypothetical protein